MRQAVEVLEGVGEGAEAARLEEAAEPGLDPRGIPQGRAPAAALTQLLRQVVVLAVRGDEPVDLGVGNRLHGGCELAYAVAVDGDAEPQLQLDLVALGDRDLAHVVAEAGDPERM